MKLFTVGLIILVSALVNSSIGSVQAKQGYSFDANCVSTECIKLKVRLMCDNDNENELIPNYLNCRTILSCIDPGEQSSCIVPGDTL